MKKIIRTNFKVILAFILGGLIFSGIGIYAASLSFASGDVDHTKSDGTKTNVKAALNELYDLSKNAGTVEVFANMTVLNTAYKTLTFTNEKANTKYLLITSANSTGLGNCRIRAGINTITNATYQELTESYKQAYVGGNDGYRYIYNKFWIINVPNANSTVTITLKEQSTYGSGTLALITTTK